MTGVLGFYKPQKHTLSKGVLFDSSRIGNAKTPDLPGFCKNIVRNLKNHLQYRYILCTMIYTHTLSKGTPFDSK